MALLDQYHSPRMDESIIKAVLECPHCKGFGGMHLHSLLQLITRRHPFKLLVGNYLSLPVRKGGYHTAGIYPDTCSQHVWGYKFKTHGTAATMNKSLNDIFHNFTPPLKHSWQMGVNTSRVERSPRTASAGVPSYIRWRHTHHGSTGSSKEPTSSFSTFW